MRSNHGAICWNSAAFSFFPEFPFNNLHDLFLHVVGRIYQEFPHDVSGGETMKTVLRIC